MKVKVCPANEVDFIHRGRLWCTKKLPCGRCLSNLIDGLAGCRRRPIEGNVDCDNCKARFICFTCPFGSDDESYACYLHNTVDIQKKVVEVLNENLV